MKDKFSLPQLVKSTLITHKPSNKTQHSWLQHHEWICFSKFLLRSVYIYITVFMNFFESIWSGRSKQCNQKLSSSSVDLLAVCCFHSSAFLQLLLGDNYLRHVDTRAFFLFSRSNSLSYPSLPEKKGAWFLQKEK